MNARFSDGIDYYFVYDGDAGIDGAIAGYRRVTGDAKLYSKWAYGFWQCKEHYASQVRAERSEALGQSQWAYIKKLNPSTHTP